MIKIVNIISFIIIAFCNQAFATDTPPFQLTREDNAAPGYLIMDSYQNGLFYLLDNLGYTIHQGNINIDKKILSPKLQDNGLISFYADNKIYLMNRKYELVDSFISVGGYDVDFHDFLILPNGNAVLLCNEKRLIKIDQSPDSKEVSATGSIIQVLGQNKKLIFQWKTLDHFNIKDIVPPFDPEQPAMIASNVNSIFYDYDGNFIISNRPFDEITKIDSKTGNIIWRLGGNECKNNQFRYLNDTINGFYGFSHQHSVTRLPNGNLLLFDNGNLKPQQYSRAVEYKLDEVNKTIEKVWEYTEFPSIISESMGSVERLPNGNTLIGWGFNQKNKTATEVKPDGSKALEVNGFQSYAVHKDIYKMRGATKFVNSPGDYDFTDSTENTRVGLDIFNLDGEGFISVEKHFYEPHNMEFDEQQPYDINNRRWVVSQNGINDIDAIIKFYLNYDTTNDANEYFIFYREFEGKGTFTPLETNYNKGEKYFETDIKRFGEFVIGWVPSILPPVGANPPDSSVDVEKLASITWISLSLADKYRLQVSKTPDFTDIIIDSSNITNAWLYLFLDYNTTYYWRVKAFYENKQSPWSNTLTFTTAPLAKTEEELNNTDISISQFGNKLELRFSNNNSKQFNFTLYDILGNPMKDISGRNGADNNLINISTDNLNDGVYFYRIVQSNKIYCGKIYIEK